jgi:type IV pilus assembly protein PilQ
MLRNFVKLSILASCLTLALVTGCQNHRSGNQTAKPARASSTPRKQASASTKAAKQTPAPTPAPEATPSPGVGLPAKQAVPVTPPPKKTPPILYSAKHDESIREIFSLANKGRWEEAEMRAMQMHELDPEDPTVDRLRNWVAQERQLLRDRAVEDQIREINAKNSVFNPTLRSLATESKDRGLPPRQDLRDAIEQIEATPYVPPTYGRIDRRKGQLFDIQSSPGRMTEMLNKEISVHLDGVPLESIIFDVGRAEGINFVADKSLPAFKQTLSVNLEKVRLAELLDYVSRNMAVQFQVGQDLIWVLDGASTNLLEETRFYRLRRGFIMPAEFGPSEITRTTTTTPQKVETKTEIEKMNRFVNDGAPNEPFIETAIKDFFTGSKYLIDYERNLIVARGTRNQLETLEKIIEEFDKPLQQVLIEARFITVSEAGFLQLGASWETGRGVLTSSRVPTDYTGLGTEVGLGLQETFTNVLGRANLSATLTALEQSGESQTLSSPRLTLVNNLPGTISDGKVQYYYEEYTVKQQVLERAATSSLVPSGKPTKLTSGVQLEVVASIGGDGQTILLALHPEVNQDVRLVTFATITDRNVDNQVTGTFEIRLPESRTQELSTRVAVKSGQTVVMGGVLEREQRTFVESVPILGNLPWIGAAFRKRTEIDNPRYLLIFVTATLLSESGEFVIYDETSE